MCRFSVFQFLFFAFHRNLSRASTDSRHQQYRLCLKLYILFVPAIFSRGLEKLYVSYGIFPPNVCTKKEKTRCFVHSRQCFFLIFSRTAHVCFDRQILRWSEQKRSVVLLGQEKTESPPISMRFRRHSRVWTSREVFSRRFSNCATHTSRW